jgi:hypothetical protein
MGGGGGHRDVRHRGGAHHESARVFVCQGGGVGVVGEEGLEAAGVGGGRAVAHLLEAAPGEAAPDCRGEESRKGFGRHSKPFQTFSLLRVSSPSPKKGRPLYHKLAQICMITK